MPEVAVLAWRRRRGWWGGCRREIAAPGRLCAKRGLLCLVLLPGGAALRSWAQYGIDIRPRERWGSVIARYRRRLDVGPARCDGRTLRAYPSDILCAIARQMEVWIWRRAYPRMLFLGGQRVPIRRSPREPASGRRGLGCLVRLPGLGNSLLSARGIDWPPASRRQHLAGQGAGCLRQGDASAGQSQSHRG